MTITNASGSKSVVISNNGGSFLAMYVQGCDINASGQILESRSFRSENGAKKWATRKLA